MRCILPLCSRSEPKADLPDRVCISTQRQNCLLPKLFLADIVAGAPAHLLIPVGVNELVREEITRGTSDWFVLAKASPVLTADVCNANLYDPNCALPSLLRQVRMAFAYRGGNRGHVRFLPSLQRQGPSRVGSATSRDRRQGPRYAGAHPHR